MSDFTLHDTTVSLDDAAGRLTLRRGGQSIAGAEARVHLEVGREERTLSLLAGATAALETTGTGGELDGGRTLVLSTEQPIVRTQWRLTERPGEPALELSVRVELAQPRDDVRIAGVEPLRFALADTWLGGGADVRLWVNTYDVWGQPGSRPVRGPVDTDDSPRDRSHWFAGLYDGADRPALTVAHRLPCRWVNALLQGEGEQFALTARAEVPLRLGQPWVSDLAWLDLAEPVRAALVRLAARQPRRREAHESAHHWGWNSWDYFKQAVTAEDILEAVDFICSTPWLRERIRYIIVDDGWQSGCGLWEPDTHKFPEGMDGLARRIREAGFVPGMWAAPFFVDRHSPLLQEHPDWAVQYKGEMFSPYKIIGCDPPWGDRGYLDPTHPGVQQHVHALYRRFRAWGFGYFKTDFLSNPFKPLIEQEGKLFVPEPQKHLRLHDPDAGLLAGHRACMQAIRAAIGEESFWLGCGTLIPTGAGLVDASRIGSDISPFYSTLLNCVRSVAWNFHWHGGLWLNDPDFAVFRGPQTARPGTLDSPAEGSRPYKRHDHGSGPPFSEADARAWASMLILSGGLVVLSDRLPALNEAGLAIVRTLVEHGGGSAAEPLDIDRPLPRVYLKRAGGRGYLGLFNWSDEEPATFRPATWVGPQALRDLWSGEGLAVDGTLTLEPHGLRVLISDL